MIRRGHLTAYRCALGFLLIVLSLIPGMAVRSRAAAPLPNEERILSFDARLQIEPSGSLIVTERIAVVALGDQIKRGIYRDLPTSRRSLLGPERQPFELLSVRRDGRDEPYHTKEIENGIRIYAGKADVMLQPGVYTYEFVYRFERQIAFFREFDELYWNVTGNSWTFPIDKASATVLLPGGARMLNGTAYTGHAASTEGNAALDSDASRNPVFTTTQPLEPYQGLTIAIGWPKGFVTEPTDREKLLTLLADHKAIPAALGVLLLVLGYYLVAWLGVGRDPEKGTIVPNYTPKLSPAAMRYLERWEYDGRCFAAALLHLAVKGYVAIQERDDTITVTRKDAPRGQMSIDEEALRNTLLPNREERVTIDRQNRPRMRAANAALETHLEKRFNKEYFRKNRGYFIGGTVLTAVGSIVSAVLDMDTIGAIFLLLWLTGWSFGTGHLIRQVIYAWRAVFAEWGIINSILALFFTGFALPFCGGWVFGVYMLSEVMGPVATGLLVVTVLLNLLFFVLLKAPTKLGRVALDEIEGMRLYLTVAEEDRLRFHYGSEKTPELFERFLPYALALGVETEWTERFADVLDASRRPDGSEYRPTWYSGSHFTSRSVSSFSSSLSSAIAVATAPSRSSSSSSGGGSSGGGGGGGGGGGW